jgi:hypothetical protein
MQNRLKSKTRRGDRSRRHWDLVFVSADHRPVATIIAFLDASPAPATRPMIAPPIVAGMRCPRRREQPPLRARQRVAAASVSRMGGSTATAGRPSQARYFLKAGEPLVASLTVSLAAAPGAGRHWAAPAWRITQRRVRGDALAQQHPGRIEHQRGRG